jgi:hypothetical protein
LSNSHELLVGNSWRLDLLDSKKFESKFPTSPIFRVMIRTDNPF